jgi:hypothetical protein
MNGIDGSAAALQANRMSALDPVGSRGSTGATQAGVSALVTGPGAPPDPLTGTTQQASAETVLSAVALALDAIIRSGGEATPAVVGNAPVWSNPDAAPQAGAAPLPGSPDAAAVAAQAQSIESAVLAGDAAALVQAQAGATAGLADSSAQAATADAAAQGGAAASGAAGTSAGSAAQATQSAQTAQSAQSTLAAGAAAQAGQAAQAAPVAALAAALAQTVTGSGLFYESHLAQWLLGQRTPAALAGEPQNRLVEQGAQLPSAWARNSNNADDALWAETLAPGSRDAQRPDGANASLSRFDSRFDGTQAGMGTGALAQNAALVRANGALTEAALLPASQDAQAQGAAVHHAVVPLVRQQLDLLATGEFRWTGEAWAGVRLDWSVQQERVESRDPRRSGTDPADAPWRTRLTLTLPSLGTVDAELTLAGSTLNVRVQANTDGAAALSAGSDALRSRLEALGLALTGLSIREVGGGGGGGGSAEAAKAANAYARAAAQETRDAQARTAQTGANADAPAAENLDWEI